jgi:ABC-type sugar transport system ATPase subunit
MVLELVRTLAGRGVGVIMISHNMNDVFEVADRVAILYLGKLVATGPASEYDRQSVVDYMTSGRSDRTANARETTAGKD